MNEILNKILKRERIKILLYSLVVIFLLLVFWNVNKNNSRNLVYVGKETGISSIVIGINHARGYKIYLKNDTLNCYNFDKFINEGIKNEGLGYFIQNDDSIYKNANNDTLLLYRNKKISIWQLERH